MAKIPGFQLLDAKDLPLWLKGNAKARDEAEQWFKANPQATDEAKAARLEGLKIRRKFDGAGLFLLDSMTVDKGTWAFKRAKPGWRFEYKHTDPATGEAADKLMSLGTYPLVSLKAARVRADELRARVEKGENPAADRKAMGKAQAQKMEENARAEQGLHPLGSVGDVYESLKTSKIKQKAWGKRHTYNNDRMMQRNWASLLPKKLALITEQDLRAVLGPYVRDLQIPTAEQMLTLMGMIFTQGRTDEECQKNIAPDLKTDYLHNIALDLQKGYLPAHKSKPHPQLKDQNRLAELVAKCRNSPHRMKAIAVMCQIALFQRPGNTAAMRWADIDRPNQLWRIPMPLMKVPEAMKQDKNMGPHCVPLPWQIIAMLDEMRPLTQHTGYVFSCRSGKPMSKTTLLRELRNYGFGPEELCSHGLRGTAQTSLNNYVKPKGEKWNEEIEANLAHVYGGPQGDTYNQAEYIEARRPISQAWMDHLDALYTGEWQKAQDEARSQREAELDAKIAANANVLAFRKVA